MVASTEAKEEGKAREKKGTSVFDRTFGALLLAGAASASFGVAKEGARERLTGLWGLQRPPQGAAREVTGIALSRFFFLTKGGENVKRECFPLSPRSSFLG